MKKLTREKQLETILTISLGLIVLFFISKSEYILWLSFAIGVFGLLSHKGSYWVCYSWLKFGEIAGAITSKVILSAIFFLVLAPVAFLSKIAHKRARFFQPFKKNSKSYYHTRNHRYISKDLENPW